MELHFTVDRDGRIDDVTSPTTDVPEAIVRNSMASMKRSRFAPRIENGVAVPTENVVFLERVMIRVTPPAARSDICAGGRRNRPQETEPAPTKQEPKSEEPADRPAPAPVVDDHRDVVDRHRLDRRCPRPPPLLRANPAAAATLGVNACEASNGFATSSIGNWVRNLAAASRMAA